MPFFVSVLQSRGPGWYRSISGLQPEMGTKIWLGHGFWRHLENCGKMARKMVRKWLQNGIWGHFPIFRAIFPHFPGEAEIHFPAVFSSPARNGSVRGHRIAMSVLLQQKTRDSWDNGKETPVYPANVPGQPANVPGISLNFMCLCLRRDTLPAWTDLTRGGGGAKRTEKQNLARMARWKPCLETLRKLFQRGSREGDSGNFELIREKKRGGGQNDQGEGVRNGLPPLFAPPSPPPLSLPPLWRSLALDSLMRPLWPKLHNWYWASCFKSHIEDCSVFNSQICFGRCPRSSTTAMHVYHSQGRANHEVHIVN